MSSYLVVPAVFSVQVPEMRGELPTRPQLIESNEPVSFRRPSGLSGIAMSVPMQLPRRANRIVSKQTNRTGEGVR